MMRRKEPPSPATWILEHLTSGIRDEALGGDLLEEFRGARSEGWYWRQVMAACTVSWLKSLQLRVPLLAVTLFWCLPAPAWKMFCDRIENAPIYERIWQLAGPVWVLPALSIWMVLHSVFIWAGILVYILSYASLGRTLLEGKLRRACLLVPLIFAPVYGAAFVLANLYWWDVFAGAKLAVSPIEQAADLGILSDVMRLPYVITMLCALWGLIPRRARASPVSLVESSATESSTQPDSFALISSLDPFTVRRFFGLMVGAGLMNAMIVGFLLCRLPASHAPTFRSLLIRAAAYVALGALAGVGGTWLYWKSPASPYREDAPIPFPLFALACASGWVWVPSMVIFSEQLTAATAFAAMIGAFVLASGLRSVTYYVLAPTQLCWPPTEPRGIELFSKSLYRPPIEAYGYVIAISLYAAGAALFTRSNSTAAALLAFSASIFAWKRTAPLSQSFDSGYEYKHAARRLQGVIIPAVLVTTWALLDGVAHRNRISEDYGAVNAGRESPAGNHGRQKSKSQSTAVSSGGYESIILWPFPEKKQIVPPMLSQVSFLAKGRTQPLIIPFDGAYWYLQPPNKLPGPRAHLAHGTPLGADIESNNSAPLIMDAHQNIGATIPIARCREIQIDIENRDNRSGAIAIAVLLTDAASPGRPTLYLGQLPIVSAESGHFSFKPAPVLETLRFPVPAYAKVRRFNEITVMMLPDVEHTLIAPKIAIRQFQLFPR